MTDVIVVGSINVDLTSYLTRWPGVGETVAAETTRIGLGGKGANQAVAAAQLGASVALIAAIGADGFGADATEKLRAEGVTLQHSDRSEATTGMAFIDVGPDGGNIIRLAEGANGTLTTQDIARHESVFAGAKVLLLQNEIPLAASLAAARLARSYGVQVIMDPAPAPVPFWPREVLEAFDIITPNAHEAHEILGHLPKTLAEAQAAAETLRQHGPRGAIVTMGGLGVGWSIGASRGEITAPNVPAIDTVAAGDCFNGALAASLARGLTMAQAIERAVQAAALATTRQGAAEATPHAHELAEFTACPKPGILPAEVV
ncbi:MAG: ribokinase [Pseudomonadota bacterium]